jgi:hypothetical protein
VPRRFRERGPRRCIRSGSIQPAKYSSKNLADNVLSNDWGPGGIISYNLSCNDVFYFKNFLEAWFSGGSKAKSSSAKNLMGIKK